MPGWQPDWTDVAFDHAAAAAAATACRAAVRDADAVGEALVTAARQGARFWEGLGRDVFDTDVGRASDHLGAVVEELLALAHRIETAAEQATAEQARRERSRERWHEERAIAERRRREAAEQGMVPR